MSIFETCKLAMKNIASSKLRTFLTMLGIIIGVGAVIVIVGIGDGMDKYMEDSFASLGTNTLSISVQSRSATRTLTTEKMYELVGENELLEYITPTVSMSGAKVGTESLKSSITGVSEDYFDIKNFKVDDGRWLDYMDMTDRKKVCVVGEYINQTFFGRKAVGEYLKINGVKFKIVGVMERQNDDELNEGGTDDCIFVPYTTAARLTGIANISSYTVSVKDTDRTSQAKQSVENQLYYFFGDDKSYTVISLAEMLETLSELTGVVTTVLVIIAGISLVVGGVGIMNIMLVSVTERTREIGIRKALGAKERTILSQFVIEAAATSALGGVIGIVIGFMLSSAATTIVQAILEVELTVTPTVNAIIVAVGVSAGIGVLFGYLPAKKAAKLNPIDALRYD